MKKSIKALFFVAVVASAVFGANCSNPETTADMKECEGLRFQKADKELNSAYKRLYGKLDNIGRDKLKKAQKSWIALRDADAEFFADSARGGTMEGLIYVGVKATMSEKRAKELNEEFGSR